MNDPIREWVLGTYGFAGDRLDRIYGILSDLQTKVRVNTGQCVILVEREERYLGCVDPEKTKLLPHDFVYEERLYLGRLRGASLILGPRGRCCFPTGGHVRCWNQRICSIGEGDIYPHDPYELVLNLDKPLTCQNYGPDNPWRNGNPHELEIMVGDREVDEWVKNWHFLYYYRELTGMLWA